MRRLLALLLLTSPIAARSQTAGQILFDGSSTAVINRTECQGTGTLGLTWTVAVQAGAVFNANVGTYEIHSADADKTDGFPLCHYEGDGATGVTAGKITTISAPVTAAQAVTMSDLVTKAGFDCTTANKTVYVCVIWKNASSELKAYAKGTLSLKVIPPDPPTVTSVTPGDGALNVGITAAPENTTTGVPAAVSFRARAQAVDAATYPEVHSSSEAAVGTKARISGLVNGRPYNVTAVTYSAEGNESAPSDPPVPGTPQPVQDAWEHYQALGGRDSGGCAAGGAGLLALVGALSLLRLRRRA